MLTAMHLYRVYQMEKQISFCLGWGFFLLEALITRCERSH